MTRVSVKRSTEKVFSSTNQNSENIKPMKSPINDSHCSDIKTAFNSPVTLLTSSTFDTDQKIESKNKQYLRPNASFRKANQIEKDVMPYVIKSAYKLKPNGTVKETNFCNTDCIISNGSPKNSYKNSTNSLNIELSINTNECTTDIINATESKKSEVFTLTYPDSNVTEMPKPLSQGQFTQTNCTLTANETSLLNNGNNSIHENLEDAKSQNKKINNIELTNGQITTSSYLSNGHSPQKNMNFSSSSVNSNESADNDKHRQPSTNNSEDNSTNLIVNYLPQNMTQEEIRSLFASIGEIENCKLIRDKTTCQNLGYGFVNYINTKDAERAILTLNGLRLQNKTIKVSLARPSSESIKGANLYISGLPKSFSQQEMEELFAPYGCIITSRILYDNISGLSRGVGFIRFDQRKEAELAIRHLNGAVPDKFTESITVKLANTPASISIAGSNKCVNGGLLSCPPSMLVTPDAQGMPMLSTASALAAVVGSSQSNQAAFTMALMQQTANNGIPFVEQHGIPHQSQFNGIGCNNNSFQPYPEQDGSLMTLPRLPGNRHFLAIAAAVAAAASIRHQNGDLATTIDPNSQLPLPMGHPHPFQHYQHHFPNDFVPLDTRFRYPFASGQGIGVQNVPAPSEIAACAAALTSLSCAVQTGSPSSSIKTCSSLAPPSLLSTQTPIPKPPAILQHSPSTWCLFVYNLAPETEEATLWRLFGPFGAVRSVTVVRDHGSSKCRGFGFIKMTNYDEALLAIQHLNGYQIGNRVLQVTFKTPNPKERMCNGYGYLM